MSDIKSELDKINGLLEKTEGGKPNDVKQKHRDEREQVKKVVQILSNDANFRFFLRYIAKVCGQFKSSIVVNAQTGDIIERASIHNESRRTVYLDIRRMLTDEARRMIESKGEEENGD